MFSETLYNLPSSVSALILFILIILFFGVGKRFRKKQLDQDENLGPVGGALLGLLALLLSFTFSASYSKYEQRRKVIVDEANSIGTAILRINLYPDSIQPIMKENFRNYLASRIEYFDAGIDKDRINKALSNTDKYFKKIWEQITYMSKQTGSLIYTNPMVPAANQMYDIVTTSDELKSATVPASIKWVLVMLIVISAFIIGYKTLNIKKRLLIDIGSAIMICLTCYLIMDLDKPRRGIITTNLAVEKIRDLNALLK